MRDYQRTKNNEFKLPRPVFNAVLWLIRDYERMAALLNDPEGSELEPETLQAMAQRERIIREETLNLPEEYRLGVYENIVHYRAYPGTADRRTFGRYKARLVWHVAQRLRMV